MSFWPFPQAQPSQRQSFLDYGPWHFNVANDEPLRTWPGKKLLDIPAGWWVWNVRVVQTVAYDNGFESQSLLIPHGPIGELIGTIYNHSTNAAVLGMALEVGQADYDTISHGDFSWDQSTNDVHETIAAIAYNGAGLFGSRADRATELYLSRVSDDNLWDPDADPLPPFDDGDPTEDEPIAGECEVWVSLLHPNTIPVFS